MALHAPVAMPSELDPTLQAHLREHFGGHAAVYPHHAPTVAPMYTQPRTEPVIWLHELLQLATISGATVATDAGTTGMAMALAYEHALGLDKSVVTSGVGTSQDGEALTLLLST